MNARIRQVDRTNCTDDGSEPAGRGFFFAGRILSAPFDRLRSMRRENQSYTTSFTVDPSPREVHDRDLHRSTQKITELVPGTSNRKERAA